MQLLTRKVNPDTNDVKSLSFIHARRGREVKAGISRSSGVGRRGFDPRQLRHTKRAFFPPLGDLK
jgi:hypothetical protein